MKKRFAAKINIGICCLCIMAILVSCADGGSDTGGNQGLVGEQSSDTVGQEFVSQEQTSSRQEQTSPRQEPETISSQESEPQEEEAPGSEAPGSETPGSEAPENVTEISVVFLDRQDTYVMRMAVDFNKANPQYVVSYENLYENRDAVLAEVMNGGGPDILCMSSTDMDNLQKNGALAELGSLLTEDILEQVYPAALEVGTYGGKLMGLPTTFVCDTMLVRSDVYGDGSWSAADVVSLFKEGADFKGLFVDAFDGIGDWRKNLFYLLSDLENSSFVTDGESHFDSPEFREILSLVKEKVNGSVSWKRGDSMYETAADVVYKGDFLGAYVMMMGINMYGNYVQNGLGEELRFMGLPSESGETVSGYLNPLGMIAVNQAAQNKPGIAELLQYLYSLENQQTIQLSSGTSVRRDVVEAKVVYNEYAGKYFWVEGGNRGAVVLPWDGKKDFYLEEYQDFMEHLSVIPFHSDKLLDIVLDDAAAYFESGKDLDEVVKSIDKRVALYLSEQNP